MTKSLRTLIANDIKKHAVDSNGSPFVHSFTFHPFKKVVIKKTVTSYTPPITSTITDKKTHHTTTKSHIPPVKKPHIAAVTDNPKAPEPSFISPLQPMKQHPLQDIKKLLSTCNVDYIPKKKDPPSIYILTSDEYSQYTPFSASLSIGLNKSKISTLLLDVTKLSPEGRMDSFLKQSHSPLVISIDDILFNSLKLPQYVTTKTNSSPTALLGPLPLLILSNISDYAKNPSMKRDLWNKIHTILRSK